MALQRGHQAGPKLASLTVGAVYLDGPPSSLEEINLPTRPFLEIMEWGGVE